MISRVRAVLGKLRRSLMPRPDAWLKKVSGVIHVGANTGQERHIYRRYALDVLWIEPIPSIFKVLQSNIAQYPEQTAIQALLLEHAGQEVELYIANNQGASSSIYQLAQHRDIWPEVVYESTCLINSNTLDRVLLDKLPEMQALQYDALVLDTQGSELLVLKGAERFLSRCRYIQTEAADFESYQGGCTLAELDTYLTSLSFKRVTQRQFAKHPVTGAYFDVLYRNTRMR